jgi:hypothetical protein
VDGCERGLSSGAWAFYRDGDHGVTDVSKGQGSTLGLDFDDNGRACFFDLDARIVKGVLVLCVSTDPDSGCSHRVTFRRDAAPSAGSE